MSDNTYVREYDNLRATSLTREMHERTCGYWYTVTSGATAHTAFRTRDDLDWWLAERGLELGRGYRWVDGRHVESALADAGVASTAPIVGSYRKVSHRDREAFDAIDPVFTVEILDNAERIRAKVTEDDTPSGVIRSIHYMNVNYRERATA